MGAPDLWEQGFRGAGQAVVVLDRGFAGWGDSSSRGELPPPERVHQKSFNTRWGMDGENMGRTGNAHGTRVAEIVYDIAPRARMILVSYDSEEDFLAAVAWITAVKVPVVVHSNSFFTPPFDGTGRLARAVDGATAAGVTWFNSAGNFGQRHWRGQFTPDADGVMRIALPTGSGAAIYTQLYWSDPRESYALQLEAQEGEGIWTSQLLAQATFPLGQRLGELSSPWVTPFAGPWRLAIRKLTGSKGGEISLVSRTNGFGDYSVREGSILTPADADGAIAVGGLKGASDALIPASSFGPRPDGRIKPDLVAPTEIHSGITVVGGTSGAAPHAAGAALLLRQRLMRERGAAPTPAELRAELVSGARDLGEAGPDNQYGAGLVRIGLTPPRVQVRARKGVLDVRAIDPTRIWSLEAVRDGQSLRLRRGAQLRLRTPQICRGGSPLQLRATDWAGNVSERPVSAREKIAVCGKPGPRRVLSAP